MEVRGLTYSCLVFLLISVHNYGSLELPGAIDLYYITVHLGKIPAVNLPIFFFREGGLRGPARH